MPSDRCNKSSRNARFVSLIYTCQRIVYNVQGLWHLSRLADEATTGDLSEAELAGREVSGENLSTGYGLRFSIEVYGTK